jgi:replicative superfamily II helicase
MIHITSDKCSKDLWHISQFVERNIRTNIILITKTVGYDQVSNVYINDEIMKFNRKLGKHMKLSEHVTILESPQNKVFFYQTWISFQWIW